MMMKTFAEAGLIVLTGLGSGCFNPTNKPLGEPVTLAGDTGGVEDESSGSPEDDDGDETATEPDEPDEPTDAGAPEPPGNTGEDDEVWEEFVAARNGYLIGLAEPILECIDAEGQAQFPLFNRCVNWHGYAHATYAMHVLFRLTGEEIYREQADALLPAEGLAAELDALAAGQSTLNGPYAHGWLLALAMERQRSTGQSDLEPLADEISSQAQDWLDSRTWPELQAGVLSGTWDNIPWVVLNLWQWGVHTGDEPLVANMETFALDVLLSPSFDEHCSFLEDNDVVDGFFAPCLHRFMVAGAILPDDELSSWLDSALTNDFDPVPLTEIGSAFQGGLNFSRAWGLWQLYQSTGDTAWRTRYAEHIGTHMMMPQFWNDPDNMYGFWVPQFGVYAIALSAESEG